MGSGADGPAVPAIGASPRPQPIRHPDYRVGVEWRLERLGDPHRANGDH
jgi:hypothetical protein